MYCAIWVEGGLSALVTVGMCGDREYRHRALVTVGMCVEIVSIGIGH